SARCRGAAPAVLVVTTIAEGELIASGRRRIVSAAATISPGRAAARLGTVRGFLLPYLRHFTRRGNRVAWARGPGRADVPGPDAPARWLPDPARSHEARD